eukprot:TRINITY_DN2921_c0_g1_i2.p1 TRINITY_DN2921_c0_g1~~TRINITY_DN2921_c0_g1_i2.p1  ORF type:complete len:311 (+),score=73.05 TRINITY_DN2921_c0_g1_i2:88-1020(+)
MAAATTHVASDHGALDTARANRALWLLKVPKVVADAWQGLGGDEQLGVLRMTFDPLKGAPPGVETMRKVRALNDPSGKGSGPMRGRAGGEEAVVAEFEELEFTLTGSRDGHLQQLPQRMPTEYLLASTPSHVPMQVFSEVAHGSGPGKLAVEGGVDKKFDLQPRTDDVTYRQFIKARDLASNTAKRTLQVWDGSRGGVSMTPLPSSGLKDFKQKGRVEPVVRATVAKPSDKKRTRIDRDTLEARVFKLFEATPFWTLKQLMDDTRQPQVFLKEVLTSLCVYHKRGIHQGQYELKPEYKKSVPPSGTGEAT